MRHDRCAVSGLLRRLARDRRVLATTANPATATVLLRFDPATPPSEAVTWVADALGPQPDRDVEDRPWHAMEAERALVTMRANTADGLSEAEARHRLAEFGRNRLPIPRRRSNAEILADQLLTLPTGLLAASAVVSLATGGLVDALVILAVVALNGVIATTTESRTEGLIATLDRGRRQRATVRRTGRTVEVDAEEVVPGDLLVLAPGQAVAADARLVAGCGVAMDEAVLTGESQPVAKRSNLALAAATALPERANMVWRGTLVAAGTGVAVAVRTGRDTEVGRIQALVGDLASPRTPLQRQLEVLGRRLVAVSAVLCGGVFALGLLRGARLAAMLRTVAALGVAAIPEGLPTVATTALALAVRDLRGRGVLVRRLEVIESMGSVSTVFFDKTGTLTQNRMAVARVDAVDGDALWRVAALCSDAALAPGGPGGWLVSGSSTETELLRGALASGLDVAAVRRSCPRLAERMRDDRRQSMATLHDLGGGRRLVAVKGSPPEVLATCRLDAATRTRAETANEAMAADGLRVLGFGSREGDASLDIDAGDLRWLGLVGLADPPRPGVEAFVAALHRSGIETVMLTGDQATTARAVARRLGMCDGSDCPVADSASVEGLGDDELADLARTTRVFARIMPGHKLRVVQAYRRGGGVVAMVGDGVNDGPALKAADIGVTMGLHGAEAARDLSDIVLEEDDLAGLTAALARGRATHDNIRKAVDFMLSTNLAEILVTAAATGLGRGQPLDPMHLLWINLVTDVLPGLALSLEPPEPESLALPPRDPEAALLDAAKLGRLTREASAIGTGVLAAQLWAGGAGQRPGTVGVTTMVVAQMLHALTSRSRRHGLFIGAPQTRNPSLVLAITGTLALHGLVLALPPLRRLLHLAPLSGGDLMASGLAGTLPYLVNEWAKRWSDQDPEQGQRRALDQAVDHHGHHLLGHPVDG